MNQHTDGQHVTADVYLAEIISVYVQLSCLASSQVPPWTCG